MSEYSKIYDEATEIYVSRNCFKRIAVYSPQMKKGDSPVDFAVEYLEDRLVPDDIVIMSATAVSIAQGRYENVKDIKVSKFASFVTRRMGKLSSPGRLEIPELMETVYSCCGPVRFFFAWIIGKIGAKIGDKELFFRVAGHDTQYLRYVNAGEDEGRLIVYKPQKADVIAMRTSEKLGARVMIALVNTGKKHIIAGSEKLLDRDELEEILAGRPAKLNNTDMPFCLIRAV